MTTLSCPGKVFIFGEYACLVGGPAILMPCSPVFSLQYEFPVAPNVANALNIFAAESPAGRLMRENQAFAETLKLHWQDPYATPIGVGSSSAQFVLLSEVLAQIQIKPSSLTAQQIAGLLQNYWRIVDKSQGLRPSGVDLALQAFGKPCVVVNEPFSIRELRPDPLQPGQMFVLAYSGHKEKTHDHLLDLQRRGFPDAYQSALRELTVITETALTAWERREANQLGLLLNEYQTTLEKMGLVPAPFANKIAALQKIEGVVGCKGAGAQGGDCALLVIEKSSIEKIKRALHPLGFELANALI